MTLRRQSAMDECETGTQGLEPVFLSLGFHNHQPAGNFGWVFEKHYERAYLPFLETMERHPTIPFSLHVTGPLLLWLCEHQPEYLARLATMVSAGRLELKGGGFYEPILALIPDADKLEQLHRLTAFLVEQLDYDPKGAWIAERVWEPHLVSCLAAAGLEYAVLDDAHFAAAGLDPRDALGYYVTEEQGSRFDLFPISKELRYLIPFREPEETLVHLDHIAERRRELLATGELLPDVPPALAVYDDDGEKFGGWPGTYEYVYGSGWLDRFLSALTEAQESGRIRLITLSGYRARFGPLGRVYIPTGSYAEMLEWSGGFFRNFLARYDEANLLHKRMLYTSERVRRQLRELGDAGGGRQTEGGCEAAEPGANGRSPKLKRALMARDHVLRSQCNDAYWHGVFGGLYLPHLRHAAYADLLTAERLIGPAAGPSKEIIDLDLDGYDEVVLRSPDLVVVAAPERGGGLIALDHLPTAFALLDTLRRRREPEHAALEELARAPAASTRDLEREGDDDAAKGAAPQTIHDRVRMKEPGLEHLLFVDRHPRGAFLDHFLPTSTTVAELHESRATELGDFVEARYAVAPGTSDLASVSLVRDGHVDGWSVRLHKDFRLDPALHGGPTVLTVAHRLEVSPDRPLAPEAARERAGGRALFSPQIDLTLLAGWSPDRHVLVDGRRVENQLLADSAQHEQAASVTLVDESVGLAVTTSWASARTARLYRYGIVTISQSEDGFERIYQGTSLLPAWEIALEPGSTFDAVIRLEVVCT